MDRIREYYNAIADTWTLLKSRLTTIDDPDWGGEDWWDKLMAESSGISGKYEKDTCHEYAVRLMTVTMMELQRICRARQIQDGEKKE